MPLFFMRSRSGVSGWSLHRATEIWTSIDHHYNNQVIIFKRWPLWSYIMLRVGMGWKGIIANIGHRLYIKMDNLTAP